jgi:hypothetical protein
LTLGAAAFLTGIAFLTGASSLNLYKEFIIYSYLIYRLTFLFSTRDYLY